MFEISEIFDALSSYRLLHSSFAHYIDETFLAISRVRTPLSERKMARWLSRVTQTVPTDGDMCAPKKLMIDMFVLAFNLRNWFQVIAIIEIRD